MNVFLAGEGPSELGDWARHPSYRSSPSRPGVIEALLRRVRADGWKVVGAVLWKDIRKYRSGEHAAAETRNVLGVALQAAERGCTALAFARDRDGDPMRATDVETGIRRALEQYGAALAIIGAVAVEEVESWILSIRGERNAESIRSPKEYLQKLGGGPDEETSTAALVATIEAADLDEVPADATSFHR